jgi:hypothetical protein
VQNTFGGTAKPTDWTLHAVPTSGTASPIVGLSGQTAVTRAMMVPNISYRLSETGGPAFYTNSGTPPTCALTGTTTAVPVVNGTVTGKVGQSITCTFFNRQVG